MRKQTCNRMKKTAGLFIIIFFSILMTTATAESIDNNIRNSNSSETSTENPIHINADSGSIFNNVTFNNVTFVGPNSCYTFNNVYLIMSLLAMNNRKKEL